MKNKKVLIGCLLFVGAFALFYFLNINKEEEISYNAVPQAEQRNRFTSESEVQTNYDDTSKELVIENTNAYQLAQSYLESNYFSEKKLVEQLIYEGYDKDVAEYVVKNLDVEWYSQAIGMCAQYDPEKKWSVSKLTSQLQYEGFNSGISSEAAKNYLGKKY